MSRLLMFVVIVAGVWFLVSTTDKVPNTEVSKKTSEQTESAKQPVKAEQAEESDEQADELSEQDQKDESKVTVMRKSKVQKSSVPNRATTVRVYLYEYEIDISRGEVPSGNVIFEVHNTGKFTHNFAVSGVKSFGKILPGETKTFMIQLEAGKYDLTSPRRVDSQYGMSEDFTVLR